MATPDSDPPPYPGLTHEKAITKTTSDSDPPPYSGPTDEKGVNPPPGDYPPQPGYPLAQLGYFPHQAGYPPPQAGQPPLQPVQTQNTTVVILQPVTNVTNANAVQTFKAVPVPVPTKCPHCHTDVVTVTRYKIEIYAWMIAIIFCLTGLVLGCCLIPFCAEGYKDVIHSCPNCHQDIARWHRK